MANEVAILVLIVVVVTFSSNIAAGFDHHMVCTDVDRNFAGVESSRSMAGRPGKRGIKGEKGNPAVVDYQEVDRRIRERTMTDSERRTMQSRISSLEEGLSEVNLNAGEVKRLMLDATEVLERKIQDLNHTLERNMAEENECTDGMFYQGICYFAIVHKEGDIQYRYMDATCGTRAGGRASAIYNSEHQSLVANYMRPKIPGSANSTYLWLAMTYDDTTKTCVTANGSSVPQSSFDWFTDFPRTSSPKVLLHVERMYHRGQGLYNAGVPDTNIAEAVLCQK